MCDANPLWGAPRIHGELLKLGLAISQASVAKYMGRGRRPPSQTWRPFLTNHHHQMLAADFFVVPTVTYRLLFVLVLLAPERRRIVHLAVTTHPTAAWTAQQLREACPWNSTPRDLIRDRDHAFDGLGITAKGMGIREVLTAPGSPWQNAYVERSSGRFDENASTTYSSSMNRGCAACCTLIGATTNTHEPTWPSRRTHLRHVRSWVTSSWSPSRKSAASITATNAGPPDRTLPPQTATNPDHDVIWTTRRVSSQIT